MVEGQGGNGGESGGEGRAKKVYSKVESGRRERGRGFWGEMFETFGEEFKKMRGARDRVIQDGWLFAAKGEKEGTDARCETGMLK